VTVKNYIRSPLKWPGGKYKLLEKINKQIRSGDRLIEPFIGGGVVSLNANFKHFSLNDKNSDLINFYLSLKTLKHDFIELARPYFESKYNNKEAYYHLRNEFNSTRDQHYKSALLLYISRHGYNGLLRYNLSGKLNVPMGQYKQPYFPEKELNSFIKLSLNATFSNLDFADIMKTAKPGDVVYCDPPYVPLSMTANFTTYSPGGFNNQDQERLATLANELSESGVKVVISNHATPYTRELYSKARCTEFPVQRMISCNGENRKRVTEILATYPAQN